MTRNSVTKVKYREIANQLIGKIDSGEYRLNEIIPQEFKLMEEFQVSRITVRNALSLLVNDGYLKRTARRGTVVTSRESNSAKLRKGMNFGIFHSSGNYYGIEPMVSSLIAGLRKWDANLCVFPFLTEIDQVKFISDILEKNIVDGVFLSYFGKYNERVIALMKGKNIPFLNISLLSQYEKLKVDYPRLTIDEVTPLRRLFKEYAAHGIRNVHILGSRDDAQIRRINILLELCKVENMFEFTRILARDGDHYFKIAQKAVYGAANRPDTLILVSGDEMIPYLDAALDSMPVQAVEQNKILVFNHGYNSCRALYRYNSFERPYDKFGSKAADMMREIMERKGKGEDFYTPCHTSLDCFLINGKR